MKRRRRHQDIPRRTAHSDAPRSSNHESRWSKFDFDVRTSGDCRLQVAAMTLSQEIASDSDDLPPDSPVLPSLQTAAPAARRPVVVRTLQFGDSDWEEQQRPRITGTQWLKSLEQQLNEANEPDGTLHSTCPPLPPGGAATEDWPCLDSGGSSTKKKKMKRRRQSCGQMSLSEKLALVLRKHESDRNLRDFMGRVNSFQKKGRIRTVNFVTNSLAYVTCESLKLDLVPPLKCFVTVEDGATRELLVPGNDLVVDSPWTCLDCSHSGDQQQILITFDSLSIECNQA